MNIKNWTKRWLIFSYLLAFVLSFSGGVLYEKNTNVEVLHDQQNQSFIDSIQKEYELECERYSKTLDDYNLCSQELNYLVNKVDSLNRVIDSCKESSLINEIKLQRIKEYNRIAGNKQNIVFLRGWINRVINE